MVELLDCIHQRLQHSMPLQQLKKKLMAGSIECFDEVHKQRMRVFIMGPLQLQHCVQDTVGINASATRLTSKLLFNTNMLQQLGQPSSNDGTGETCKGIMLARNLESFLCSSKASSALLTPIHHSWGPPCPLHMPLLGCCCLWTSVNMELQLEDVGESPGGLVLSSLDELQHGMAWSAPRPQRA